MIDKIEVTIDVIIHATEDIVRIFQSFEELLNIKKENFTIQETTGYFDNPITMLNAKIIKKEAKNFMKRFLVFLSTDQINELIEEIEERTIDSRFHMRLDKQELVKRNIVFRENDAIKIKIHTPIYNRKNTVKTFTEIFQVAN